MEFKPATCPNCGGSLQLPNDKQSVKCMYCGIDIVVQEAIQSNQGKNIDNILVLANTSFEGENWNDSHKYYSEVLEYENNNIEAWIGKGASAGWQYTLANPTLNETITCIKQAVNIGIDNEEDKRKAGLYLNQIAISVDGLAYEHMQSFKQHSTSTSALDLVVNSVSDTSYNKKLEEEYLGHASVSLETLILASSLINDIQIAKNIFTIATKVSNLSIVNKMEPGNYYSSLVTEYEAIVKKVEPNWQKPKTGCYIATATMGSESDYHVITLKSFRDNILNQSSIGNNIIHTYYRVSPPLASLISKSKILRMISYQFVVKPWTWIAKFFLAKKL